MKILLFSEDMIYHLSGLTTITTTYNITTIPYFPFPPFIASST